MFLWSVDAYRFEVVYYSRRLDSASKLLWEPNILQTFHRFTGSNCKHCYHVILAVCVMTLWQLVGQQMEMYHEPDDHNMYLHSCENLKSWLSPVVVYMFTQTVTDVLEDWNNKYIITNIRFLLKICDIINAVYHNKKRGREWILRVHVCSSLWWISWNTALLLYVHLFYLHVSSSLLM